MHEFVDPQQKKNPPTMKPLFQSHRSGKVVFSTGRKTPHLPVGSRGRKQLLGFSFIKVKKLLVFIYGQVSASKNVCLSQPNRERLTLEGYLKSKPNHVLFTLYANYPCQRVTGEREK